MIGIANVDKLYLPAGGEFVGCFAARPCWALSSSLKVILKEFKNICLPDTSAQKNNVVTLSQ
jgi:hypothetical protein